MNSIRDQILNYYNQKKYTHLSEKAYDIIIELIITLQFEPDAIYPESAFVEMADIGRTPIREALKRLEFIKILQSLPRSGIHISSLRSEDAKLEREVRCAIEELIIKKTSVNAFPHERYHLRELMMEHDKAFYEKDFLRTVRSDLQFHLSVANYARNPYAQNALLPFLISECRLFYLYVNSPRTDLSSYSEIHDTHIKMMQYIVDGDGEKACECLRNSTFTPG